jgi:hypothetical protein
MIFVNEHVVQYYSKIVAVRYRQVYCEFIDKAEQSDILWKIENYMSTKCKLRQAQKQFYAYRYSKELGDNYIDSVFRLFAKAL